MEAGEGVAGTAGSMLDEEGAGAAAAAAGGGAAGMMGVFNICTGVEGAALAVVEELEAAGAALD